MKTISYIFIPIFIFVFFSCTVYREIPIDVLKAEEFTFPGKGSTAGFLYRNFKYPNDTLQHYFMDNEMLYKDKANLDKNIDSLAAASCLSSASSVLYRNGVIGKPVLFPAEMMPDLRKEKIFPLPSAFVHLLGQSANVSYIVSLEVFSYFFSHFTGTTKADEYEQVTVAGVWSLYKAETGAMVDSKAMIDTVYWSPENNQEDQGDLKMPPQLTAILQASETFGENYARKFFSEWITVDRILIIPPLEEFRMAAEYASQQDWEKARGIWERYSGDRLGRLAVNARYNIALSYEISDQIEEAINRINQAYSLAKIYNNRHELEMIRNYQSVLSQRKKEIDRLKLLEKKGNR
jgi:hypothetical protein